MAYASVASLMRTIEPLLTSNSLMQSLIRDHREEICALHEKVSSLEAFLKNFEKSNVSGEMTDLEVLIKEVSNIEHTIQLRVTEVVLANDENLREKANERLSDSLQQVTKGIDCIWKQSTNIQDKGKQVSKESLVQDFSSSAKDILNVEVANVVEHTIQLKVTEVVLANDEDLREKAHERPSDSLQQVAEDIDHISKESTKIQDKGKQVSKEALVQDFSGSAKDILNVKNSMVGRDDQRKRLLEDLTGGCSHECKVIPIVGMGGIGKTTLAKEVYNDVLIVSHFDVRAWATVSQQHNVNEILLSLLRSTKVDTFDMDDEAKLPEMLQKSLKSRRYLIVLDDMWKIEAWDDVRQCFPREENGSRILLTTRNTEVACSAGTGNLPLQMSFMDQDESWNLFKSAAFAGEALPSELETIGKQIAEECHGLPLTIVVVAGLLKSKRETKYWERVAKDVKSFFKNDLDEQCLRVLELSYNHLTSDLKTCLLYFGIFPEDSEIPVMKLKRVWMAEGFLNLEKDLEGVAEKCLQDLINRCLVLVSEENEDETIIRSCKVHDQIYDLCLREVQKGNIFIMNDILFDYGTNHVPSECQSLSWHKMQPFKRWTGDAIHHFSSGLYRALLTPGHHQLTDGDNTNLLKRTHSIFFTGHYSSTFILISELIHFKLLKVLDLSPIEIYIFPLQILNLIWLSYLSLCCIKKIDMPPEICRLWNLQTFIIKGNRSQRSRITFPEQIWGLMQLRHLKVDTVYLPNRPSGSVDKGRHLDFSNIQTISYLFPHCCTEEVISGIQNVKKIGIRGDRDTYKSFQSSGLVNNLVRLQELETLTLKFSRIWSSEISPVTIPSAKVFPATLKKLELNRTYLSWSYLDIIAELPNLEVLKLMFRSCHGEEWDLNDSVFTRLKLLLIHGINLKYWKATDDNFPVLERLVISYCRGLKEIPIEFAEINSLQLIELRLCNTELQALAAKIQQEKEELGNIPVDVRIINRFSMKRSGDPRV